LIIQIVTTSVETKPTAKGSYQQLEVVFKNLTYQGKVESKKIMSFGANAPAFTVLKDAQSGATNEATLRQLKGKRHNVDLLLTLAKMEKLNGTYYRGLVKLREEMDWPKGLLHGNFQQTVARTGRLSSSKPNLQNFATELQDIFVSKY